MLTETITWTPAHQCPDADETVLIYSPTAGGEPVGMGYWCPERGQWHTAEGMPLDDGDVTHWAAMPGGPPPASDPDRGPAAPTHEAP